jgi:hypothetical protein
MATKSFKIGEYAIGGIIKVDITGKVIQIKALDYFTKEVVSSGTELTTDPNIERMVRAYLEDLSTYGIAEKIWKWIEPKIK